MCETCSGCGWAGIVLIVILAVVGLMMLDLALDNPIRGRISSWLKHWPDKLPRPHY